MKHSFVFAALSSLVSASMAAPPLPEPPKGGLPVASPNRMTSAQLMAATAKAANPNKPDKTYGADNTLTLIGIFPVTDDVVIQSNLTMKEEPIVKMDTNKAILPPEGTAVKLVITPAK